MKKRLLTICLATLIFTLNSSSVFAQVKTMPDGTKFDPEFYAAKYPDVVAVLGNSEAALYKHYQDYGQKEGRLPYSPDGTTVAPAATATVAQPKTPIEILKVFIRSTNSVGGVTPNIVWRNNSGKTIKYITFSMVPINAVGDVVTCDIRRYSTFNGTITGPIEPAGVGTSIYRNGLIYSVYGGNGSYYASNGFAAINGQIVSDYSRHNLTASELSETITNGDYWDCAWYNWDVSSIGITGIQIDYMDGTHQSVKPETVLSLEKANLPFTN